MAAPADKNAPARVMPEIAFAPDINGVCKVAGTLEISSKPRKIDRTRIKVRNTTSNSIVLLASCLASDVFDCFVYDGTVMSDQAPLNDVVLKLSLIHI